MQSSVELMDAVKPCSMTGVDATLLELTVIIASAETITHWKTCSGCALGITSARLEAKRWKLYLLFDIRTCPNNSHILA